MIQNVRKHSVGTLEKILESNDENACICFGSGETDLVVVYPAPQDIVPCWIRSRKPLSKRQVYVAPVAHNKDHASMRKMLPYVSESTHVGRTLDRPGRPVSSSRRRVKSRVIAPSKGYDSKQEIERGGSE